MTPNEKYHDLVELPYQVYERLFLTLPFSPLHKHGSLLPLFARYCEEKLDEGVAPLKIVDEWMSRFSGLESTEDHTALLFLFLQQVERQVLLFDAVERAAHDDLYGEASRSLLEQLKEELPPGGRLRLVLTAHPTEFYPPNLFPLITKLSEAIGGRDLARIQELLLQLGHTSFRSQQPPTPLQEAERMLNQFGPGLYDTVAQLLADWPEKSRPQIELGFWPGGDRDGNPNVTMETTQQVLLRLKQFAWKQHQRLFQELKECLTFKKVLPLIEELSREVEEQSFATPELFDEKLAELEHLISEEYLGLYLYEIRRLRAAVQSFGFHFAHLDIRQSSRVIRDTLAGGNDEACEDLRALLDQWEKLGLGRFIVSHTETASDVLNLLELHPKVQPVPLFESMQAINSAPKIIEELFSHPGYLEDLGNRQTVMLGFSDGTKDGGYVACNWAIQRCKEALEELGERYEVQFIFFDGRGGPPARGGGNTGLYYRALAERIPLKEIELTIQGQTVSSLYGHPSAILQNIGQLLSGLIPRPQQREGDSQLDALAAAAHRHYLALREDPCFLKALATQTPLSFFGDLNIGSRPAQRQQQKELSLENLRAIPFVGAWSLVKMNLPAFYGLGSAMEEVGPLPRSHFVEALLGNANQALNKSNPKLTRHLTLSGEPCAELWQKIHQELARTQKLLAPLAGAPVPGILLRETIIQPLLVILQAALQRWQKDPAGQVEQNMIRKAIPAIINASRNSA